MESSRSSSRSLQLLSTCVRPLVRGLQCNHGSGYEPYYTSTYPVPARDPSATHRTPRLCAVCIPRESGTAHRRFHRIEQTFSTTYMSTRCHRGTGNHAKTDGAGIRGQGFDGWRPFPVVELCLGGFLRLGPLNVVQIWLWGDYFDLWGTSWTLAFCLLRRLVRRGVFVLMIRTFGFELRLFERSAILEVRLIRRVRRVFRPLFCFSSARPRNCLWGIFYTVQPSM